MDTNPTIRTSRGRDFYLAYLNTPDWRKRRTVALRNANWKCQVEGCTSKRDLQVHHLTYDRLGSEWDEDLVVLCRECHEGHHIAEMEESAHKIYMKLAASMLRESPFASVGELSDAVKRECVKLKIKYNSHQIDKALNLLVSSATFETKKRDERCGTPLPTWGRPLTHGESRELLARLGLRGSFIKTMADVGGKIDIYAEIREETVEYDRY